MNRRSFLGALAASAGALILPGAKTIIDLNPGNRVIVPEPMFWIEYRWGRDGFDTYCATEEEMIRMFGPYAPIEPQVSDPKPARSHTEGRVSVPVYPSKIRRPW